MARARVLRRGASQTERARRRLDRFAPVDDIHGMEVLEREDELGGVESDARLREDALALEPEEELAARCKVCSCAEEAEAGAQAIPLLECDEREGGGTVALRGAPVTR